MGAGARREFRFFAKKELFSVPLLSGLIRHFGAIPIDRSGADRRGVARALELVRSGEALLIFPEGTRIRREGFAEPREGIGLLALSANCPVVPVHVASTYEPRRSFFRRIPIVVRYGEPLRFASEGSPTERRAQYGDVARRVMDAIARLGEKTEN